MLDPDTLDVLAFKQMPYVPPPTGTNPALNTAGGAYFYLDNRDRAVFASSNRRIFVVGETTEGGQPAFEVRASYDPTPCLQPDERMPSVLPDYRGRFWFVGRQKGTIGVLDPSTDVAARSSSGRRSRTPSRSPATAPTLSATRRSTSCEPDAG